MDGVLNVSKPAGPTSHDVVAKIRRILREKRVGHTGTLDPLATGVLVVCLGKATRIVEYLVPHEKEYQAELVLGRTTTTQDSAGEETSSTDASHITREMVEEVLPRFTGKILQIPPMVSAVKHQGKRLYELARKDIEVERKPREVTIHELEITSFQVHPNSATLSVVEGQSRSCTYPTARSSFDSAQDGGLYETQDGGLDEAQDVGVDRLPDGPAPANIDGPAHPCAGPTFPGHPCPVVGLRIVCSSGTYIRTLCADIGEALGVGGYMKSLVRTRVGRFRLEDAIDLETLEKMAAESKVGELILAMDDSLSEVPAVTVDNAQAIIVAHGGAVSAQLTLSEDTLVRVKSESGDLLAVGRLHPRGGAGVITPEKVFAEAGS